MEILWANLISLYKIRFEFLVENSVSLSHAILHIQIHVHVILLLEFVSCSNLNELFSRNMQTFLDTTLIASKLPVIFFPHFL
jgi:hypothetical protein